MAQLTLPSTPQGRASKCLPGAWKWYLTLFTFPIPTGPQVGLFQPLLLAFWDRR